MKALDIGAVLTIHTGVQGHPEPLFDLAANTILM